MNPDTLSQDKTDIQKPEYSLNSILSLSVGCIYKQYSSVPTLVHLKGPKTSSGHVSIGPTGARAKPVIGLLSGVLIYRVHILYMTHSILYHSPLKF